MRDARLSPKTRAPRGFYQNLLASENPKVLVILRRNLQSRAAVKLEEPAKAASGSLS